MTEKDSKLHNEQIYQGGCLYESRDRIINEMGQ